MKSNKKGEFRGAGACDGAATAQVTWEHFAGASLTSASDHHSGTGGAAAHQRPSNSLTWCVPRPTLDASTTGNSAGAVPSDHTASGKASFTMTSK